MTVFDRISSLKTSDQTTAARFTATLLVMRDMIKGLPMEDPLMKHTYVDYLYHGYDQALKCLNLFYGRIQENPRARTLFNKYEVQMLDAGYGAEVIDYRLSQIIPFFNKMQVERTEYHKRVKQQQAIEARKKQAEDQKSIFDLTNADAIHQHLDQRSGT